MAHKTERRACAVAYCRTTQPFGPRHPGDVKPAGSGISELRIDHGPGYRVYFQIRDNTIILLLCGGDKGTQTKDIQAAKRIAAEWKEEDDE